MRISKALMMKDAYVVVQKYQPTNAKRIKINLLNIIE